MTKADIVNEISKDLGVEKRMVQEIVDAFMESVRTSLSENNNVYLNNVKSQCKHNFAVDQQATINNKIYIQNNCELKTESTEFYETAYPSMIIKK